MRLLARVYADGPTPSKVNPILHDEIHCIDDFVVVAEFYEAQVYGQIFVNQISVQLQWLLKGYMIVVQRTLILHHVLPIYHSNWVFRVFKTSSGLLR